MDLSKLPMLGFLIFVVFNVLLALLLTELIIHYSLINELITLFSYYYMLMILLLLATLLLYDNMLFLVF